MFLKQLKPKNKNKNLKKTPQTNLLTDNFTHSEPDMDLFWPIIRRRITDKKSEFFFILQA